MRAPASIHSPHLRRGTRGEYWSFFMICSHSLPAPSRWGRNLIRGKYHQSRWRGRLQRLPPVVCCLGSSRPDRCKLCGRLRQFCLSGVGARRAKGGLLHIQKKGWRPYSTPLQTIVCKVSATNLTPPSGLLCLQLKYIMNIFMRLYCELALKTQSHTRLSSICA